jgi:two-component system CheB/CheR fusion protein
VRSSLSEDDLEAILALVAREHADLRDYKRSTLVRRVEARMDALGSRTASAYRDLLASDPDEVARLADSLLVHTTAFHRDGAVFEALATHVLPSLQAPLQAWCIGSASGEEAWTLAAVLARAGRPYRLVATDRDARSVAATRAARYDARALAALPDDLRAAAFDDTLTVRPEVRACVHVAEHDLLGHRLAPREVVLLPLDLVLVRNVLVYLDARFQAVAADRLASIVRPGGALVLGPSETLTGAAARAFDPFPRLDPALRIYRRRPESD